MTSKLKPWLFLALIFAAGIMTGVALTIVLGPRSKSEPDAQQMKNHWMLHLTHQLNLTADQQAKIDPILTDAENKIQAARKENFENVSQIFKKANAQIATILTPDQQAELEKMSKEMDRDHDRMFPGHHQWGGPHGGPGGPGGSPPGH
jgi:Spy/CpxP family protein refolding chaperone